MQRDANGVWTDLQAGDVLGPPAMGDVWPPLIVIALGDGIPERKQMGGYAGSVAMVAPGTQFRIDVDAVPAGAEPDPPEVKERKRRAVWMYLGNGEMRVIGDWAPKQ